jgi:hypothetical protein
MLYRFLTIIILRLCSILIQHIMLTPSAQMTTKLMERWLYAFPASTCECKFKLIMTINPMHVIAFFCIGRSIIMVVCSNFSLQKQRHKAIS